MQRITHDVHATLVESLGDLAIKRVQEVPDEFLQHCADDRFDSLSTPAGEMHRVASVPVYLVEKWQREGFDVFKEPVAETIKRLRNTDHGAFLTSMKM